MLTVSPLCAQCITYSVDSSSAMLGGHYGRFTTLSEGGPSLSRCGTLHSAAQCCTVSHSATAWVQKSGIADVDQEK